MSEDHTSHTDHPLRQHQAETQRDPVCGMKVDPAKAVSTEYNGKTYRRWLKRHPIAVALVLAALAGFALGWDWLAASGLLVVALAGLGCLLMCVFALRDSVGEFELKP